MVLLVQTYITSSVINSNFDFDFSDLYQTINIFFYLFFFQLNLFGLLGTFLTVTTGLVLAGVQALSA